MKQLIGLIILLCGLSMSGTAQEAETFDGEGVIDYSTTRSYTLAGVTITGTQYYDANIIRSITGLVVGQSIDIPGEDVSKAIRNLWKQGLFANVYIKVGTGHVCLRWMLAYILLVEECHLVRTNSTTSTMFVHFWKQT